MLTNLTLWRGGDVSQNADILTLLKKRVVELKHMTSIVVKYIR